MKQYTIKELNSTREVVVFIDDFEDYKRLKQLGFNLTDWFGSYCYCGKSKNYSLSSTRTCPGSYTEATIITPDQVLGFVETASPDKMEKPYTDVGEVDYKMITTHPYFKTLSLEELADIIGYMNYEGYKNLEGEFTIDKVKILFEKFNQGKMEKELIGYNIKPEFKDSIVTIARALDTVPYNLSNGTFMLPDKGIADRAKELNVLDLWFDPVYEESLKPGDYVKWTGNCPTYGIIDKACDPGNHVSKNCYVLKNTVKERVYSSCHFSNLTKVTEEEYFDALIAETEKRYPIGCKVNQKNAYRGKGGEYRVKDSKVIISENEGYKNLSIGGIGVFSTKNGIWAEVIKIKTPVIEINGYKGEFFDTYVKFGCAEISKEVFIDLATIAEYDNTNRSVESVTIGNGVFTKAQIQEIANYYQ